jgi:hypothetical protein
MMWLRRAVPATLTSAFAQGGRRRIQNRPENWQHRWLEATPTHLAMSEGKYDIRLRNAIARSGDPDLFPDLNIPCSIKSIKT